VTTVTCLFIVNKKKRNIKSRKIDKRKRKMLVLIHIITYQCRSSRRMRGMILEKASKDNGS